MLQTALESSPPEQADAFRGKCLAAWRFMLLVRLLDDQFAALYMAAVEKLPLVLVIADNQYAYSTPTSRQFACDSLADKAAGYGVEVQSVDGTDLAACLKVLGEAVTRARGGGGPQMVVANLLRLC